MIIGIDDTDSEYGMCTTYLTALLIERLKDRGKIRGMPHLTRLNPNIKYKTRGNAALSMDMDVRDGCTGHVMDTTMSMVEEMADMGCDNTNPGVVFIPEEQMTNPGLRDELEKFLWSAMRDVLRVEDAMELIKKYSLPHKGFKNGRGLIGALAACGALLCDLPDHTYELIAYRKPENFGTPRDIDRESVFRADNETYPGTWDTVDYSNDTVVFAPHSPDPILYGIRGDDITAIQKAFDMIESEIFGLSLLYKTNQGTDLHLMETGIGDIGEERSYLVTGTVADIPRTIRGGHVFFKLEGSGSIECAAFEPTKGFRHIVNELIRGDRVSVCGGVKKGTLNVEKLEIIELASQEKQVNPLCPSCNRRMKSAGQNQGYRCRDCGTKSEHPVMVKIERNIKPGIYEVPPCARRHISKPLIRSADPRAVPSR